MKRITALLLAVVMAFGLLAGCNSGANTPTGAPDSANSTAPGPEQTPYGEDLTGEYVGGDLTWPIEMLAGEWFEPYAAGMTISIAWPSLQHLATQVVGEDEWKPLLAESWERDDEEHSLTIHLKKGITFHNGDTFDAHDVVFTLSKREDYGTMGTIGNPVSIEALDDYTVKVTWADFALEYEYWIFKQLMYSKETFEEKGENWMLNNIVGTGPYIMTEFVNDDHMTFVRNENYWEEDRKPTLDSITFVYIQDPAAQAAAFLNGTVDRVYTSTRTTVELLKNSGYETTPLLEIAASGSFIIPMTARDDSPLSDPAVRNAIYTYGIDWNMITETCGGPGSYHIDAYGLNSWTYYDSDLEFSSVDYDKAKELLAEAGYPDGFTSYIYTTGQMGTDAIATAFQAELKKLGIEAEIVIYDMSEREKYMSDQVESGFSVQGIYYMGTQTDRLYRLIGPYSAQAGATKWSDEMMAKYNAVVNAMTQEDQNQALHDFVEQYVQVESIHWPVFISGYSTFLQPWCHYGKGINLTSGGMDPFEVMVDPH